MAKSITIITNPSEEMIAQHLELMELILANYVQPEHRRGQRVAVRQALTNRMNLGSVNVDCTDPLERGDYQSAIVRGQFDDSKNVWVHVYDKTTDTINVVCMAGDSDFVVDAYTKFAEVVALMEKAPAIVVE